MPSKWIDALKKWNTEKGGSWCIPRKGSPEMTAVRSLMEGTVAPSTPSAPTRKRPQVAPSAPTAPTRKKPQVAPSAPKPDKLSNYFKGYSGQYQSYEDSRNEEVMYPTKDVKEIIKLAYNGKTLDDIVREVGYNKEETATMIYDHFINRNDVKNVKPYTDEASVMKIVSPG